MQPHSMCAVALAGYMWNKPDRVLVNSCQMNVEYQSKGEYKLNKYELTGIRESEDRKEIKVYIMRGGGGLSCEVTVRRRSVEEGAEAELSHSQIHISGLREVFNIFKKKIASGTHYNSQRYRKFEGEFVDDDRKQLVLYCEVKTPKKEYVTVKYDLRITQIQTSQQ